MKLDRSRPYGERYPASYVVYEQDNRLFDRDGNEVEEQPELVTEPEVKAVEVETSEARRIDLRKKENRHLRPAFKAAEARKAAAA